MPKDKVGALVILAVSIAYGATALNLPEAPGIGDASVTPSSLPVALSVMGIAIAILILILPARRDSNKHSIIAAFKGLDWRRVCVLFLLMVCYGLTIKPFGFLISTMLFLWGGFWVMGERRIGMMLIVSIGVTVVFWFILTRLLNIYLEPGILFRWLELN